jgi:hypothetical protein
MKTVTWACLGNTGLRNRLLKVGISRLRLKTVWEGPWHFQKAFSFSGQQMVALNLQCSQVRKEESI